MKRKIQKGKMSYSGQRACERNKIWSVMHEFKNKRLHSWGGKRGVNGPRVKKRKQAIAIALNSAPRFCRQKKK